MWQKILWKSCNCWCRCVGLFCMSSYSENTAVLSTGSRSRASNNSKKTSSSSSSGKKTTLSSSQKAPSGSGNSKKKSTTAKEKTLRRYGWAYVGILLALLIVPLILRNHRIVQSVYVSFVWIGLYRFCTFVDHFFISSSKWKPLPYLQTTLWLVKFLWQVQFLCDFLLYENKNAFFC